MNQIYNLKSFHTNLNLPFFFFIPTSTFKQNWDILILILCLCTVFFIPLELGIFFLEKLKYNNFFIYYIYFEYFISGCLFFDLIFNFRTALYDDKGNIIIDLKFITKDYFTKYFLIDSLSMLPLDFILNLDLEIISLSYLFLLKIPRILRFVRIVRCLFNFRQTFMKIARMFFIYFLFAHYFGCMICYTDFKIKFGDNLDKEFINQISENSNLSSLYTRYVNLAILVLVGNNIQPQDFTQRILFVVMFYIGTLCDAIIFGSMAIIFAKTSPIEKGRIKKNDDLILLLNTLEVDEKMRNEILEFHDIIYWKNRDQFFNNKKILKEMNKSLMTQINLIRFSENLIKNSNYLQNFSQHFLVKFTSKLKQKLTHPFDIMTSEGDVDQTIFFIGNSGKFNVKVNGNNIKVLNCGDFFGEISFFLKCQRRTATVTSSNISMIYYLKNKNITELFYDFPQEAKEFFKIGFERFKESQDYFDEDFIKKLIDGNEVDKDNSKIWEEDILIMLKNYSKLN